MNRTNRNSVGSRAVWGNVSRQHDQGNLTGNVSLGDQLILRMNHEGGCFVTECFSACSDLGTSPSLGIHREERSLTKTWSNGFTG